MGAAIAATIRASAAWPAIVAEATIQSIRATVTQLSGLAAVQRRVSASVSFQGVSASVAAGIAVDAVIYNPDVRVFDQVTVADIMAVSVGMAFNDICLATDSQSFDIGSALTDSCAATDSIQITADFLSQFSDTATASDEIGVAVSLAFSDSASASDSIVTNLTNGQINGRQINAGRINN